MAQLPTFKPLPADGSGLAILAAAAASQRPPATPKLPIATGGSHNPASILPPKLVKKIRDLEFVEMTELLPETWQVEHGTDSAVSRRPPRRGQITDFLLWTECCSSMMAVLAGAHPTKAPEFFAYLKTIIRAHRNYDGTQWEAYDRQYRRQALATKDLNWSRVDSALYNEAFTGRAKTIPRCAICLSENHLQASCPDNPQCVPQYEPRYPYPYPITQRYAPYPAGEPTSHPAQEICNLYNQERCTYRRCKRAHICLGCSLPHPLTRCPQQQAVPLGHPRAIPRNIPPRAGERRV